MQNEKDPDRQEEATQMSDAEMPEQAEQTVAAERPEPSVMRWFGPIELQDGKLPEWIPLHRVCNRSHPVYGAIVMTEAKMDQAIANFNNRVLRPDSPKHLQIPIDTRHAGDAACGWITEMRKQLPYLMGRPDWTEHGKQVVLDRQFLYISPVYQDDPEQGPIFKEATLTNRDFLKMPPILLDEGVNPGDFLSPFVAAGQPPESHTEPSIRRSPMPDTVNKEEAPAITPEPALDNGTQDVKALEEMQGTLKSLSELVEKQNAQLAAQAAQLAAAENDAKLAEVKQLTEAAARRGVDAFTVNTLRSILLALPRKTEDVSISLEVGDQKQAFPNLYAALSHYLEHVPGQVPVDQELTKSDQNDPNLQEPQVDAERVRQLIQQAHGQVKEA